MTSLLDATGIGIAERLSLTDLTVDAGQMVAVIGPNGGGKTSLLRALARTEDALGQVIVDGQDVDGIVETQRRRLLAFLPASREVSWPVTVRDFLVFGHAAEEPVRIEELIEALELGPLAHRPIDQLSTGERARAMLGRAIAGRARLLLLDEPLSNLDPYWALRITAIVRAEIDANRSAALMSVHDLDMAAQLDRVLLVSGGALLADGPPARVIGGSEFTAAFRVERSNGVWTTGATSADRRS